MEPFTLSPWVGLNQPEIKTFNRPGIYIIAVYSEEESRKPADPLSRNILYIGETVNQTVAKRLYQFKGSAFKQRNGHSGGWTLYNQRLEGETLEAENYMVTAFMPEKTNEIARARIPYLERKLIFDWVVEHHRFPPCNRKYQQKHLHKRKNAKNQKEAQTNNEPEP